MRKLANDLKGKRFGRLEVIGVHDNGSRKTYYVCQCDCGNVKVIRADALVGGMTKSCGCLKKEQDKIYINTKEFNKNSTPMKYQLVRRIIMELCGNIQCVEMVHIKDTCKLIETSITGKQYILGNKYKVVIEKKNIAVFVNNM